MTKLWLSLGLIDLFITFGICIDQGLRFGIWWEWEEFLHHETFIGIFFYSTVIFLTVALVEHRRNLKKRRKP